MSRSSASVKVADFVGGKNHPPNIIRREKDQNVN